jgi:hypothetical protein
MRRRPAIRSESTYNVYCDESGHLQHDNLDAMVLGAVWCPLSRTPEVAERLRDIKKKHGLPAEFEIKWDKVSVGKQVFYQDIMDYFFDSDDLHFRALIASEKHKLQHEAHNQDHDTWYYKMYFTLLTVLFEPTSEYRVYLDIKDTTGAAKVRKLHDILSHNMMDYERGIITRIQTVRSHEVEQVQLADLLIGAVQYAFRGLRSNPAKVALVDQMRRRSGYSLKNTTLLREEKVNIFVWTPRHDGSEQAI